MKKTTNLLYIFLAILLLANCMPKTDQIAKQDDGKENKTELAKLEPVAKTATKNTDSKKKRKEAVKRRRFIVCGY